MKTTYTFSRYEYDIQSRALRPTTPNILELVIRDTIDPAIHHVVKDALLKYNYHTLLFKLKTSYTKENLEFIASALIDCNIAKLIIQIGINNDTAKFINNLLTTNSSVYSLTIIGIADSIVKVGIDVLVPMILKNVVLREFHYITDPDLGKYDESALPKLESTLKKFSTVYSIKYSYFKVRGLKLEFNLNDEKELINTSIESLMALPQEINNKNLLEILNERDDNLDKLGIKNIISITSPDFLKIIKCVLTGDLELGEMIKRYKTIKETIESNPLLASGICKDALALKIPAKIVSKILGYLKFEDIKWHAHSDLNYSDKCDLDVNSTGDILTNHINDL